MVWRGGGTDTLAIGFDHPKPADQQDEHYPRNVRPGCYRTTAAASRSKQSSKKTRHTMPKLNDKIDIGNCLKVSSERSSEIASLLPVVWLVTVATSTVGLILYSLVAR